MFCMNCGAAMNAGVVAASASCGKTNPHTPGGADVQRMIREASTDARDALRRIAVDPIGGLAASHASLGEARAHAAGVAFGVAFALLCAIAAFIASSRIGLGGSVKVMFGAFVVALVPFAAIAAASAAARRLANGAGTAAADVFTAGIALQPIALVLVLAALLGIANFEVTAILALVAWTYTACILFTGVSRLAGVPERFAPLVVAIMVLAALWLTKVAASALLGRTTPLGRFFG